MERFEIFTICRRPPVLQTDASVGMMKNSSSRDGSALIFGAADFRTPITRYRNIVAGECMAKPGPLLALSACKI